MPRVATLLLLLALPGLFPAQAADTLEQILDSKTITIAYRTDARPFSFEDDSGQPVGYTVDLCKRVVASIEQQLGTSLEVKWLPATSKNRLELVRDGEAQLECGSTTATLSRMEIVDFSSPVWVDSTGLLVRKASGARSLGELAGKKVAVVADTTNQRALQAVLDQELINATVVPVDSRDAGVAALEKGEVDAFASDKVLLLGIVDKLGDPGQYGLLADDLSFEPYAIALPRNDSDFRLAVNRGLARVYRSEAVMEIFKRTFGPEASPKRGLLVMYGLGALPE